jgi:hypothetical protein
VHGKSLPLAVLLDAPTVEQLAAVLRDRVFHPAGFRLRRNCLGL